VSLVSPARVEALPASPQLRLLAPRMPAVVVVAAGDVVAVVEEANARQRIHRRVAVEHWLEIVSVAFSEVLVARVREGQIFLWALPACRNR
jgi:hypothetical protein